MSIDCDNINSNDLNFAIQAENIENNENNENNERDDVGKERKSDCYDNHNGSSRNHNNHNSSNQADSNGIYQIENNQNDTAVVIHREIGCKGGKLGERGGEGGGGGGGGREVNYIERRSREQDSDTSWSPTDRRTFRGQDKRTFLEQDKRTFQEEEEKEPMQYPEWVVVSQEEILP